MYVINTMVVHVTALPTVKRLNTDATRPQMSIKTTEPKVFV